MKKIFKLSFRIVVTLCVIFLIFFGINKILEIKHKDKINNTSNDEWSWMDENHARYFLLEEKYPSIPNTEDYLLVRMKNSEVPEKKENEKRILVVGDSYVFGTGGTNVNYTWWKQLNMRIKEAGYSNVNVYAAAYYGLNTKEELNRILKNERLIKKINPDLIIMGYVANDPEDHNNDGSFTIKVNWEEEKEKNPIYQKNPTLYYELVDRLWALDPIEYDKIIEIGEKLGFHRWDARLVYMLEDGRLNKYKKTLMEVDKKINELGIPYFYAFTNSIDNVLSEEAYKIMYDTMNEMNLNTYYKPNNSKELLKSINSTDNRNLDINFGDDHPGIVWTYNYSIGLFEYLKNNYSFIFENPIIDDVNKLELNINDTVPFLELNKKEKNVYEFVYPKKEEEKTYKTYFLRYPLETEHIKLNLEYSKNIKKIILTGDNLESAEIYVNVINSEYGYDLDEAHQKVTPCKYLEDGFYEVNKKITSVNIVAQFKSEDDRNLRIEFVE